MDNSFVNLERVKTGRPPREKLTEEALAERLQRIKEQNEKIRQRRLDVQADEEAFKRAQEAERVKQSVQINHARDQNARREMESRDSGQDAHESLTELLQRRNEQNEKIRQRRLDVQADEEAFKRAQEAERVKQSVQINHARDQNARREVESRDSGQDARESLTELLQRRKGQNEKIRQGRLDVQADEEAFKRAQEAERVEQLVQVNHAREQNARRNLMESQDSDKDARPGESQHYTLLTYLSDYLEVPTAVSQSVT